MSERTVLIIGAGIGGLSAGCYAQMNGYRTRILEMHAGPGGVCASWKRQGYVFDGCMHNLAGTAPDSRFQPMWRELGVIPRVPMQRYDELVRVERPDGEPLKLLTDLDRLEAHLQRLSPADAKAIHELIHDARWFAHFDVLGLALASPLERARAMAGAAPMILRWSGVTLDDYAARLSDPFLRKAFPTLVYDWPQQSMLMLLTFMGRGSVGDYGWPQGGSHALAEAVEARFRALGGEIRYGQKVAEILVEDGRAAGVRLQDGREERADIVISNANGHATIYGMLGGRFTSRAVRDYYGAPEDRIEMGVHVSLGVARDLSGEPHALVLPLPEPTVIDEEPRARLYVEPFGFDPSLAPPGKATLKVVLATSWRRWAALAQDPQAYAQAKDRIAQTVIGLLEPRWPGLRSQIEAVDVATPITTQRFTGNGQGYKLSVAAMTTALMTGRRLSPTLPGLADFYMVGQWAGPPGGVPLVAAMGRDTVRRICRRDGRSFRAFEGVAAPFEPGHRSAA